jgi:hydroxymethylpyrimidine pyrophosphatase-like HAD family hydrolase
MALDGFSINLVGARACAEPAAPPARVRGLEGAPLKGETEHYGRYRWCLDAFPTVRDVRKRLRRELWRVEEDGPAWPREEAMTNVFLLGGALSDTVDDYLAGEPYDFSRASGVLPGLGRITTPVERLLEVYRRHRESRLRPLRRWRERWGSAFDGYLEAWLAPERRGAAALMPALADLAVAVSSALPADLLSRRVRVPAAFRTQDLAHQDILALGARLAADADPGRPVLVVGLRTAGSFFAPLVRIALVQRGFSRVETVTLRPKQKLAGWERDALARCAADQGLAVVVDEPADTGTTLSRVVEALRHAGVPARDVVALLPVHPSRRDWRTGYECLPLDDLRVIALAPEDWHKSRLLQAETVERTLQPYFRARGFVRASVLATPAAERFNRELQRGSDEKFHTRLKRVFEARLESADGRVETRYVLAKSVGWGWLGYHAFLAAEALREFVPPVLGQRDGILYVEWLPQGDLAARPGDREDLTRRVARYVAARARALRLDADPVPHLDVRHQKGAELLASALSAAYGWKTAAVLKRSRLRHELARRPCPVPTLIDGKMRRQEWVRADGSWLKTDFEHHGMGKTELNVTDPAYDLADAILHLHLSAAEEEALVEGYRRASGDEGVGDRLFLHKLLAGTVARGAALDNLADPRLRHRAQEFNRSYLDAWSFLTAQTVRLCGRAVAAPAAPAWGAPLVVMDVDGVLDKQIFGFPSTTAAGVEALSLLHAHGMGIAFNTARTLAEVQEYCRAYGGVGGVAEYGSVAWDAVAGLTRVLVSPESREELQRLARAVRPLPGVFLNDDYQHSLRAYTYEHGRTMPLPGAMIRGLVADLGLGRLRVHQTYLDTTVLAREVDKGQGLLALLGLAGQPALQTVAIGDSEPDFAMFRVASRSFAPRHVSGRSIARRLGCRIADRSYQAGLLGAARLIVHPEGGRCRRCPPRRPARGQGLFWEMLAAADRPHAGSLLRVLADPMALRAFVQ